MGPGAPNQNSDRTVNNKVETSKIIKSTKNCQLICKIFMIKTKIPKSLKVAKTTKIIRNTQIIKSIKNYQVICKIFMIQPKSPKVEKLQNTPSEPSCQPENGLLTFHSRTCKIMSEHEPARRPNHFTFKCARTQPTAERLGAKTTSRSKAQGCASEH